MRKKRGSEEGRGGKKEGEEEESREKNVVCVCVRALELVNNLDFFIRLLM